jgi:hypothetical protein
MRLTCLVLVEFESERGIDLPKAHEIAAALQHSTAAEALAEATDCAVRLWLPSAEDLAAVL